MNKWHKRWIERAEAISKWSKDPSTKVGCVLVCPESNTIISEGYNGFPRRVNDDVDDRWERPGKYNWIEHAERNAVFNAARLGRSTRGAVAYMNYAPQPCSDCTRALIQAGISTIVGPNRFFTGKGRDVHYNLETSPIMLDEAGVKTITVDMDTQ